MVNINDNRVLIIDKGGTITNFSKNNTSVSNCIKKFTGRNVFAVNTLSVLSLEGNVIFVNKDKGLIDTYLPKKLTDEQLYQLDLATMFMDGIKIMNIKKNAGSTTQQFLLESDISNRFSKEVIQSYFNDSKKKIK